MGTPRALVIGGSIAGLLAANALRSIGWDAVVCERATEDLRSRGAGLGTHAELVALLARLGLAVDHTVGIDVRTRICLDRDGRITHRIPMPQRMSAWARIYRLLKDALPASAYRFGRELSSVEHGEECVVAVLADGSRERADLLVGADGIRSTVRQQLWPEIEPRYAGYIAWRCLLDEAQFPPMIREEIFDFYTFCLPRGEVLLSYPVPGRGNEITPGRRGYNIIWYRPTDARTGLRDLCTDEQGVCHGTAIAPPLIRREVIADMRAAARRTLAPQIATLIELAGEPFFQAIFDLESPRMAQGRIALLGDAAFVARPHVGMGVTKAALDAQCLIDALAACDGEVEAALSRYDAQQRPLDAGIVAQARRMGACLEAGSRTPAERAQLEHEHAPEIVMRSIGSPLVDLDRLRAGAA